MNSMKAKAEEKTTKQAPYIYAIGKRKTSIAIVKLFPNGKGEFLINNRKFKEYFTVGKSVASFLAPFKIAEVSEKNYDLEIKLVGGGASSGAEACRHGITRALVKEDEARRSALKKAGFLTRDSRTKERKKPGLKRARRAPQWSKR
jgi:small subunit ribosomal protein S9